MGLQRIGFDSNIINSSSPMHGDGEDGYVHYTSNTTETRNVIWANGLKIDQGVTVSIETQLIIHSVKPVEINGTLSGKGEGGKGGDPPDIIPRGNTSSSPEKSPGNPGEKGDFVGAYNGEGQGGNSGETDGIFADSSFVAQLGGNCPSRKFTEQNFQRITKPGMFDWEQWYKNTYTGGSGGGSGGASGDHKGGAGGNGGGIILILAPKITGTGEINCDGTNGEDSKRNRESDAPSGPGGGGCGGFIFLQSNNIDISTSVSGGKGGTPKDGKRWGRWNRRKHGDSTAATDGKNGFVKKITK